MIFSSPIFLFLFLPIVLTFYFVIPNRFRNLYLLVASLCFYFWGERKYTIVMLISIFVNHIAALVITHESLSTKNILRKSVLVAAVVFNLGLLGVMKYAGFFVENVNLVLQAFNISKIPQTDIRLTLGISFFTFQGLSYVIDTYRRTTKASRNLIDTALYISFFPQLIAGPIVRYHDVFKQIKNRAVSIDDFTYGIERFITGLGKKVLIANPLALAADHIFAANPTSLSPEVAWLGILLFGLQIYFDFSAYSDMAIGLARMFGFQFLENFNYPYIARSITDFWRRWHISLTNWFKDYVYIPLGGSRSGLSNAVRNILIVFIISGLWHGASWNFVLWGTGFGIILACEKILLQQLLTRIPRFLQHLYTLVIVGLLWVLFNTYTLEHATQYYQSLFGLNGTVSSLLRLADIVNVELMVVLPLAIVFSMPIFPHIRNLLFPEDRKALTDVLNPFRVMYFFVMMMIMIASSMALASGAYNPFIYFRF